MLVLVLVLVLVLMLFLPSLSVLSAGRIFMISID